MPHFHPISLFAACLLISQNLVAQLGTAPGKYWLLLKDKENSPYSLQNPHAFLSEAALERRAKAGIPVGNDDIPVNPGYLEQIQNTGAKVLTRSRWFNAVSVQIEDSLILQQVQQLPCVLRMEKVARIKSRSTADDLMADLMKLAEQAQTLKPAAAPKNYKSLSGDPIYGDADVQTKMIGADQLHTMGFRGENQVIAVLDAGFFKVNEFPWFDSLRNDGRLLGTRDFVAGGEAVFEDNSHGLSVLSTMAANNPGMITGTAPKAKYWLLRTENAESEFIIEEDNWVAGAEFADSVGAHIINSSLGYTEFDDTSTNHTYSDLDGNTTRITIGADKAASKGILVVNSAGNSGTNPWFYIGAPADGDSVLTVGAVNSERNYASFSSHGPTADGRIKPNVCAMGQQTFLAVSSGDLARSNGTSFSGPIIAGAAACLWQAHPEATAMEVFKAIEQSADQYENPDDKRGFGVPDMMKAHGILARHGLNEFLPDSVVNVYPNPFIEGLSLEFFSKTDQEIKITVTKLSGKKVYSEIARVYPYVNTLIQLEKMKKLSAGTYVITIETGSRSFIRRVIKN